MTAANVNWQGIAIASGSALLALLSFVFATVNTRINEAEKMNLDQAGRILLLEKQATLNRSDIDHIAATLAELNKTLVQVSLEHKTIMEAKRGRQQ